MEQLVLPSAPPRKSTMELLLLSDFGRLNPARAKELATKPQQRSDARDQR